MPADHDAEDVESIPAWKLISEDRDLKPDEWERWYFIRVVVWALATAAFAVIYVVSSTAETTEPTTLLDVSGRIHEILVWVAGAGALWTALMLTISTLGLLFARRVTRRTRDADLNPGNNQRAKRGG